MLTCEVISLLTSFWTVSCCRICARRSPMARCRSASWRSNPSLVYGAFILLISVSTSASTAVRPSFSARCMRISLVIRLDLLTSLITNEIRIHRREAQLFGALHEDLVGDQAGQQIQLLRHHQVFVDGLR